MGSELSSLTAAAALQLSLERVVALEREADSTNQPCAGVVRTALARRRLALTPDAAAPLWRFDLARDRWVLASADTSQLVQPVGAWRLLTFNIWFDALGADRRTAALIEEVIASDADVICLQETTPRSLSRVLADSRIRQMFVAADVAGETHDAWYGTATLVAVRVAAGASMIYKSFSSVQGRRACIVRVPLLDLHVCNVHLESNRENAHKRLEQLGVARDLLAGAARAVIAGDFNLHAGRDDEDAAMRRVLEGFADVWNALHPDEPDGGLTFDNTANAICCLSATEPVRLRIDRVLARGLAPASIEVRGREPIGRFAELDLFVSDHFGVLVQFD